MAKQYADRLAKCIGHTQFSVDDIKRLEDRVKVLKDTHEFDDENHAYMEAAARIAADARNTKDLVLGALSKEDKAKAAPKAPVQPGLPKYDNIPDLATAVAQENKLSEQHATAYVEHAVLGRSMAKIANDMGIGKSTVGDMVKKMRELMEPAKSSRLEAGGERADVETAPESAVPTEQEAVVEEAAPDQRPDEEAVAEGEETVDEGELAPAEVTATGDLVDEDNVGQGQEDRAEVAPGINITDTPHGEGKTKADNDAKASREYKKALKNEAGARKLWEGIDAQQHKRDRVQWDELGEGQRAWFAEEAAKGKAADAYTSISTSFHEGMKFAHSSGVKSGTIAGVSTLRVTATQNETNLLAKLYPALGQVAQHAKLAFHAPTAEQASLLAAATINLLNSSAKNFGRMVLRGLTAFSPVAELPGQSLAGVYNTLTNAVGVSDKFLTPIEGSPKDAMRSAQRVEILVHELTHAADYAAAQHVGGQYPFATMHPLSVTHIDVQVVRDNVKIKLSPLMSEALRAFIYEPDIYHAFGQPLVPLQAALDEIANGGTHIDSVDVVGLADAAENAMTELVPRLMEMYLGDPALLKRLPLGYALAHSLANATSVGRVAELLGVKNGQGLAGSAGQANARSAPAQRSAVEGDSRFSRGVRDVAEAGSGADPGRVSRAAGTVRESGQTGSSRADAGPQRGDGLDIPPPEAYGGIKGWLSSVVEDKWRAHPSLLGWLTTEQLADRFKDIPMVRQFSDLMQRMAARSSALATVSDGIKSHWEATDRKLGKLAATAFRQVLHDATDTQIWPDRPLEDQKHLDRKDPDVVEAHAKLAKAYNALSQAYKDLFHSVLGDLQAQYDATVAGYRKGIIEGAYPQPEQRGAPSRELIDEAAKLKKADRQAWLEDHDTSALARNTYKALWVDLDDHALQFPNKLAGPYFPKVRFGDHVVAYKSAAFREAEHALTKAREDLENLMQADSYAPVAKIENQIDALTAGLAKMTNKDNKRLRKAEIAALKAELETAMGPIRAQREVVSAAQSKLTKLKQDPASYGVEFYESLGAAKRREEQLTRFFGETDRTVERSLRDQHLKSLDGVTPSFMRKLEDRLSGELPAADAQKVRNTVRELYLQMQPENSASKARLRRVGVAGTKLEETVRAYATASLRNAFNISRLEYRDQLNAALNELRFTRKDDDAKMVGNELAKRLVQNSTYEPSKALTMLSNATYLTYLGVSPSFLVTQLTQPWVISAPIMAGRHGMAAVKALGKASADAGKLLKVSFDKDRTMRYAVDTDAGVRAGLMTADEATMLKDMFSRGRIDITITHDLGAAASGEQSNWLSKATQMSAWPAQQAEVLNRIATALAAYRLETQAGTRGRLDPAKVHDRALRYADQIVSETHLNYAAENRARLMHPTSWGGWGRIMFQFRAYQQGMLYLIYKNMADGLRGDRDSLKAVGYLMGMQLATAGLAGLPLPGAVLAAATLLYKGMTDDDEEKDLKEMFFQGLKSVGGETFARAVTKGTPAALGIDLSGRVGMGNIASLAPYADDTKEGRDMVAAYWIAMTGGPAAGMAANWAESLKAAGKGDFVKATSFATPKAIADLVKAGSWASQGMADTRGNTILRPDEISAAEVAMKAFGFQPTDMARMYDQRSAFFEARQNRTDARASLMREFAKARAEGGDVGAVREKIQSFNGRHPDARIKAQDLERAVAQLKQRDKLMRGGVPVGKREEALADELGIER